MTIKCQSFFNDLLYFCKRELSRFFKLKIVTYMKHGSFNFDTFGAMRIVLVVLMAVALPFLHISCNDKSRYKENEVILEMSDYVDLGLPSGTLWATRNVGASRPEECGDYFAWGETKPNTVYSIRTYKWFEDFDRCGVDYGCGIWHSGYIYKKYNDTDNKIELDPEDDAAYVNWGSQWRMPSLDQFKELVEKCALKGIEYNGVIGMLVTGPNGKMLFLPAAGFRDGGELFEVVNHGNYWSRTLDTSEKDECAFNLRFVPRSTIWHHCFPRAKGLTVRPVRVSQN